MQQHGDQDEGRTSPASPRTRTARPPIEVKDSEPNVAKVIKQLKAGTKAAEELAPRGVAVIFRPVLVSKSLRTHKRNELRGAAVKFRNQRERVRHLVCGDSLTEAIGSS